MLLLCLGMHFYFDETLTAASESSYPLVTGPLFSLLSIEQASSQGIFGDLWLLAFYFRLGFSCSPSARRRINAFKATC